MEIEVMLKKDKSIKSALITYCILLSIIACNNHNQKLIIENKFDTIISKNFTNYALIYNQLRDTLNNWHDDSLAISLPYYHKKWKIDSLIAINKSQTRLVANLLQSESARKNADIETIQMIGGAKINEKWYFFFGITSYLGRETYQDSIYSPLTFDELSYLSRQELSGAYTINPDSSITTIDRFFDFMYKRSGWGLPENSTLEQLDSVIVAKTEEVRKMKIDPKELEDIKKDMARSVRPPEPKTDISLWQKLFGKEEKLFESKEWKEYLKKKYGKVKQ